jgi:hypothetical protein
VGCGVHLRDHSDQRAVGAVPHRLPLLNPPHPGDGPIFWFVRFMALGGGALFFWVGVRDFPRVLRRNRVRMKAKRPERVGPHPVWDIPSIFTATQAGGLS